MNRFSTILLLILVGCFFSCEEPNYPDNIYEENPEVLPNPTITSISPPDSAFSGIGIITITGTNFSSEIGKNLVYFNGNAGTVQSASPTEIVVKAAKIVSDSVKIQVAVIGAYEFAEWDNYGLYSSVVPWGGFDPIGTSLWAIAMDPNENLYVSESGDREILRVFANGTADSVVFAEHSKKIKAIGMRFSTTDTIVMAMVDKKIYSTGSHDDATELARLPSNTRAYTLDYDSDGNMYAGGRSNILYRINLGAGETEFSEETTLPEDVHMNTIRVYENYVYILGEYIGSDTVVDAVNGIYRAAIISADSLGPSELVLDWDDALGEKATKPLDFTFAADGGMIVGVDYDDPSSYETLGAGLYEVSPPYSGVVPVPVYEDVFKAPGTKLVWGNDKYLYVNNRNTASPPDGVSWDYKPIDELGLYRIDMARLGAPYYGRSL
ncbi:MAG: IPT/TIG domain-containing protein [Fidelibacterota bacterium]